MTVGQNVNAMANGKMVVSTQTILAGEDGGGGTGGYMMKNLFC